VRYPDEVTRLRASGEDLYGNPDRSFTNPGTATLDAFVMFQDEGARFFLPPGTDLRVGDRVTFDGATYEVQTKPKRVRSPSREVVIIAPTVRIAED